MTVEAIGLGKTYGSTRAVDSLSFELRPGLVTGFLGPNGAGKSTTMRLMLGLDRGDGRTLWDGKPLGDHDHVTRVVGAHLDAKFFHPSRSARNHLRMLATEASVPSSRIDEVVRLVGLDEVAAKRPSGFSLGMGQRLDSPARSSRSRRFCSSTSRPTASIPSRSSGCATSCATTRSRATRSSCRATCSRRCRSWRTTSW